MVHILTNTKTLLKVEVRPQESQLGDPSAKALLQLKLKQQLSLQSFVEQQEYLDSSAIAAYVSLNKLDQRQRYRAGLNLVTQDNQRFNFNQGSTSSGLGYALALFEAWWSVVLNKPGQFKFPVFATGEILTSGHVKPISHLGDKIDNACDYVTNNLKDFTSFYLCYPASNDDEISHAQRQKVEALGGFLMPVVRLQNALGDLIGDAYDGDPLGRWQPFKGLKSFDYEDSVRFFGRDKDVERLYSDIKQNSGLLIVSGASGTGKSSLIKAGLIPKLEQEHDDLHWAYCTPNSLKEEQGVLRFILEQLFIAWDIKDQNIDELVSTLNHAIEEGITSLSSLLTPDTKQCLLYLDQYEEVFSQSEQDIEGIGRELSIIDGLAKALPSLNIVLAIRNEYLGRLLDNQALRSPIISNVASQLTSQEWEAIVHEQALFSGITFESKGENNEALDTIIIEEAIKTPYALPMVSFLLEQLYSKAIDEDKHASVLQHKHYQALGGLTGAIAYRALTVLQESEASEKTISTFFDYFVGVNPEGLAFARCVELANIASNKTLYNLVKGFIDANLIVSVAVDRDNSTVKLAHDSLFTHWDTLKKWIEGSKEYLLWRYSIDGQYTRWQKATTNKKDYLLKDKQILKEGKGYLKLNLICDSKLKGYLSASLKQKNRKKLSVFFVFIILPLLLVGIYQWDKHRIKSYYYSAVGERWSVPFGINKLTDEQVKHRTFSYRLDYQGGALKRLAHVNSFNTLSIDESRRNAALWEYEFSTDGMIQSIVARNHTGKVVETANFQFNGSERAIVDFSSKFGKKNFKKKTKNLQFLPFFKKKINALNFTNSDISQYLLTYSSNGYLIKKAFQNPYGTKKPIRNQFYGVMYEYDQNGQIKLEYYIDNHGRLTSGESKIAKVKYEYDHFGNILNKEVSDKNEHGGIIQFSFDQWGNKKEQSYLDKFGNATSNNGIAKMSNDIDQRGNIIKKYLFDINNNLKESQFSIAIEQMEYDHNGRLKEISFLNHKHQLVNNKEGYSKQVSSYDGQGRIVEAIHYDKDLKPTPNQLGCTLIKRTYNEYSEILSDTCLNENRKLTANIKNVAKYVVSYNKWGFKKQQSMFGENDQLTLNSDGFAQVVFEINMKGNTLSESYFGIDGNPIKIEGDVVKNTYKYDDQSNVVEQSFWDEQGNLTEIDGLAIFKNDYDDLGRQTQEYYLDKMGQPILRKGMNYYKKTTKYSTKGDYITSINYFDVNGNVIDVMSPSTNQNIYPVEYKNVKISSFPEGAKVFFDNKFVGITPFYKYAPSGKHALKIVKADYQELTRIINIRGDELVSLNFNLLIPPKPEAVNVQPLQEKANKGDSQAQYQLGNYYSFTKKNYDIAKGWYEKAANNGSTEAMNQLGLLYIWNEDASESGVYWLNKAANAGVLQSQYTLGYLYLTGEKILINDAEALKWLTMAAHKGHASSQYELGRMNYYGWGTDKDSSIAFKLYLNAANAGHALSCNALASLYRKGEGTVKNLSEAFYWNMLAAELGNEESYYRIGDAYFRGIGVNKDTNNAILWLMKAFQSKDKIIKSSAAGMLGLIYENGGGISSNFEKAFFFHNKALEDDDFTSAFPLAYMYLQGHGVEVNYTKAVELFKLALSKGDKRATEWLTQNGEI